MSDDHFYHKARYQGLRSRASYKLLEINEKMPVFKSGNVVVDLGSAPGGWAQIAAMKVGGKGKVIAIDRAYIPPFKEKNIEIITADIMSESLIPLLTSNYPIIDVVLSDCAPNVSGIWDRDQGIQIMLAERALEITTKILKPQGYFVTKLFQGNEYPAYIAKAKQTFENVKTYKPKSSRKKSAEIYLIGSILKSKKEENETVE